MQKVLNLYAGLGGNRKKWTDVEVTAVETESDIAKIYRDQHPNDKLIIGDAMEYLRKHRNEFGFVWASPPCQKHSKMMKATRHDVADYIDISLYQIIIFLTHFYKGKWCVENVKPYYDPLIKPTCIIGRHYFWSNFEIAKINITNVSDFITNGTTSGAQKMKDWLDIKYEGNIYYKNNHCPAQVLRNCVHPNLGLHIYEESKRIGMFTVDMLRSRQA